MTVNAQDKTMQYVTAYEVFQVNNQFVYQAIESKKVTSNAFALRRFMAKKYGANENSQVKGAFKGVVLFIEGDNNRYGKDPEAHRNWMG